MSHHKIVIAFLALLLLAVTSLPANEGIRVRWNIRDHVDCADVSVCVHRGAGDLAPENALPSLLFTWELQGCNGIPEVDIRTTKDGILAMFHDGDFRRILPDAPEEMRAKRIEDLTWKEVQQIDVGAFRGEEFKGQRVVSLGEICQALRNDPKRKVLIDVKNVNFEQLARETDGLHSQVILATGRYQDLVNWKRVAPDSETLFWMGLGAGEEKVGPIIEQLKKDEFAHVDRMQIHVHFNDDGVTRPSEKFLAETLDYIHANYPNIEVQLMPWDLHAAETPEHYKRLADLGAAGFGTDRPDICFEAMKQYYKEEAE
ncbi:MAG: glycerophosphodiester phosphodiesterase [Thermoguttaceae bacterium]|jgi:glycerophosphoryl diester phosphodiesterase